MSIPRNAGLGVLVDGGLAGSTGGVTPPYGSLTTKGSGTQTGAPKAYLNILVFDHRDSLVDFSFTPVTEAAREYGQNGPHQELFKEHVIKQAGLVYIYLSNDNVLLNGSMAEVYFDDFTVEHFKSPVVQQDDYYAFGLEFNSYQRENATKNNYLYNGKGKQDELGLGWLDYGARMYQPEIARWNAIDPSSESYVNQSPYHYAGNNPVAFVDYDGNDFGVSVNRSAKTITISAQYITQSKNAPALNKAIKSWNSKSGDYVFVTGGKQGIKDKTAQKYDININLENAGSIEGNKTYSNRNTGQTVVDKNTTCADDCASEARSGTLNSF